MKAAVRHAYGGPEVVEVVDRPRPEPGDGDVMVEVRAASINTADLDHLVGRPLLARVATGLRRPRSERMGFDVAGVVLATGDGATRLKPGDHVWADLFAAGSGAFAEFVCASEDAFTPMPANLAFEDAATVPHSAILALQALEGRGPITARSKILINGGGGMVGPWAIQLAKAFGAEVTGVDHTDKLDLMLASGADRVVDYTVSDVRRTGERYDVIVDVAATQSVLSFRRALAPGGAYLHIARSLFGFFSAALLGGIVSIFGTKRLGVFTWKPSDKRALDRLGAMLVSGEIRPMVDRTIDLEQIASGLKAIQDGTARGKIVVTMT